MENKQQLNRIGFIINPDAQPKGQILYILINREGAPDLWDPWKPCSEEGKSKDRSVREYAQALFMVLSYACRTVSATLEKNGRLKHKPRETLGLKIYRTDETYGYWATRLFNVIKAPDEYQEVPSAIRDELKPLLTAIGRRDKKNKGRIEITADCWQRVFFWNISEEPFISIDFEKYIREGRSLLLSPVPPNSFELAETLAFSQQIRESQSIQTWQDLYRCYAVEHKYMSSPEWLKTTSLEVEYSPQKSSEFRDILPDFYTRGSLLKFRGAPLQFHMVVERHKNVLLTGPAGSGKTTTFKLLANSWLCNDKPSEEQNLSFYVRLKEADVFLEKCIRERSKIDITELIGRSVVSVLKDKCNEKELKKCKTIKDVIQRQCRQGQAKIVTCNEMLKCLRSEVIRWFKEEGCHRSTVMVLIDGINELRPYLRDVLKLGIEDLSRKQCRIAVSCRSNFANRLFPEIHPQFTRFELQELNNQQIINYLEYKIPGRGEQIFNSQIRVDQKLLSMAKNPFYLFLIEERVKKDPASKIPTKKAKLIEDFILDSIERKRKEGIYPLEFLKDDMIYIILPKVAKWSISMLTSGEIAEVVSFPDSKEFKDIQNPAAAFNTLEVAESYGLLRFSGLLEESREYRGYPAFLHDNFRDFFAALYLKSLEQATLMQQLQTFIEYFAWDEPLLFFLELTESNALCQKITEFALSKDVVLAGMCARHARTLDKALCVRVACEVAKLPRLLEQNDFVRKIAQQDEILHIRSSPMYPLGRLLVSELISIKPDKSRYPEIRAAVWLAVAENVKADDFDILKNTWVVLPKIPNVEVHGVLAAIARIPTYEAFDFFVKAYKNIFTLHSFKLNEIAANLFNYFWLDFIAYVPSLSQAATVFPPATAPNEFDILLSKVEKVGAEELSLLEKLVFHEDKDIATKASDLLAKTLDRGALPTLVRRLGQLESKITNVPSPFALEFFNIQLRDHLLRTIAYLAPEETSKLLIEEIEESKDSNWLVDTFKERCRRFLLYLLSETHTPEALIGLIKEACSGFYPKSVAYCASLLETWPQAEEVLAAIRDYRRRTTHVESAMLLGASVGAEEFFPEVATIFNSLFSKTVFGQKRPPPSHPGLRSMYDKNPESWHEDDFEEALAKLPLAVRAVRRIPNPEIGEKLLQIIAWQFAGLKDRTFEITHPWWRLSPYLLAECTDTLAIFASVSNCKPLLDIFLNSDVLKDLIDFTTRRGMSDLHWECRSKIACSLTKLCENVPREYVPQLFLILSRRYKESVDRISSGGSVDLEGICEILVALCRRTDDNLVIDLLRYLKSDSHKLDERYSHITPALVKAIKIVKGRRFLAEFPAST